MALFSFKRRVADPPDSGEVSKGRRTIKRSPPVAMEVKLLALEGLEAGLSGRSGRAVKTSPARPQRRVPVTGKKP